MHSPFVFELATKVIPHRRIDLSALPAEKWRRECLGNPHEIQVTDFGTGVSGKRRICDIACKAAKSPKQGQLLARLVAHFKPAYLLELGTSLGITSIYQARSSDDSADPEKFISIEGCPETAKLAEEAFRKYGAKIDLRTGNFDEVLGAVVSGFPRLDYVYFDGNHRKAPTLRYFETCLSKAHPGTIFIFDDIHWSREMEEAWEEIRRHEKVTVSIDLFDFGLVFFREGQEKEHFVLTY